jgi:hypothetical protein
MNTEIQTAIDNLKKAMGATDAHVAKMKDRAAKHITPERVAAVIKAARTTIKVGAITLTLGFLLTTYALIMAALTLSNIIRMARGAYELVKEDYQAIEGEGSSFPELRDIALEAVVDELAEVAPAVLGTVTEALGNVSAYLGDLTNNALMSLALKLDEEAPFDGSGIEWDTTEDDYPEGYVDADEPDDEAPDALDDLY